MKVIAVDSSQIEARITGWLAEHKTLLELFSDERRDVYAEMGTQFFGRKITKEETPDERQLSKAMCLGCNYQMSWAKLAGEMLKGMFGAPPRQFTERDVAMFGVDIERFAGTDWKLEKVQKMPSRLPMEARLVHCAVAEKLIWMYRDTNKPIVELWGTMEEVILTMDSEEERAFGPVQIVRHGIVLPNGLMLRYPGLRQSENGWSYMGGKAGKQRVSLYGGKMTENLVQALARVVISDQMLMIYGKHGMRPVTCTHDELVYVVEDSRAEELFEKAKAELRIAPDWAPRLPLGVTGGIGQTYGEAK